MKVYVVSRNQDTLDLWSQLISTTLGFELVNSADGGEADADVIVMSEIFAVERYGGSPGGQVAQVRPNELDDGLPDWVVIAPALPRIKRAGRIEVRDDFKGACPAYFAILESLRAIRREFGDSCSVELYLPFLAVDDLADEFTPKSVTRAFEDFLDER